MCIYWAVICCLPAHLGYLCWLVSATEKSLGLCCVKNKRKGDSFPSLQTNSLMSNIPQTSRTKFWSNRVAPTQKPSHSQGAGIAGENGFWVWKVSSEIWLGLPAKFSRQIWRFLQSGALCPHAVAASHAEMSHIPYMLEEFLLKDDWLPRTQKFHRKSFAQTKAHIFNCFEANNVVVWRSKCRTNPQKIHQLFPTLFPVFLL